MEIPKELGKFHIQLGILAATLILYLLSQSIIFAILIVLEFMFFVVTEFSQGAKAHGWKKEIMETAIALAIAVAVWYGLGFILNTSSPISAVVSCSMLPNLQRGDMVVIQGSEANTPTVSLPKSEIAKILAPESTVTLSGTKGTFKGSIYSYCTFFKDDPLCAAFRETPSSFVEERGALRFNYGKCAVNAGGGQHQEPCVTSVDASGKNFKADFSNDIIVYEPKKGDLFSLAGDIIHRTYLKLKDEDGNIYYLTKGDNNPVFDIQVYDYSRFMGNMPADSEHVKGKVLFRIPFIGYLKLFISGFFSAPEQCSTQLTY